MNNFRTVGAYWYSRQSTLNECTEQLLEFLLKLQIHNPQLFNVWFRKGRNKKQALENQVSLDYHSLINIMGNSSMEDKYPDISYRASLWNGRELDEEIATVSVTLGSSEMKGFTNNCVLKMPYEGREYERYQKQESQRDLIELLNEHWNPEWISVDGKKMT